MVFGPKDDFIFTIDDDGAVQEDSDAEEDFHFENLETSNKKQAGDIKSGDKHQAGGLDWADLVDEEPTHAWEFSGARAGVDPSRLKSFHASIDEKINKKRAERQLRALQKPLPSEHAGEAEGSDDDDEPHNAVQDAEAKGRRGSADSASEDELDHKAADEDPSPARSDEDAEDLPDADTKPLKKVLKRKRAVKDEYFAAEPAEAATVLSFDDLKLSRGLLKAINKLGYTKPTPIQSRAIPVVLAGHDVCGSAVTGSGKTAAFVLPILERLVHRPRRAAATRVLILLPTRELAAQCFSVVQNLAAFTDVTSCLVVGALSMKLQETELRKRPDIVVATPGRMIDHLRNSMSVGLDDLEILVLDEADRLLEMSFKDEVHELVRLCPKGRQTMLFSATMTEEVDRLIELSLNHPVRVSVDDMNHVALTLVQEFIRVKTTQEQHLEAMLLALCQRTFKKRTIIFFRSKRTAHRMKLIFGLAGLSATELHGNLTQLQRLDALEHFRDGKADFLLATDLAARGLDIQGVTTVVNFDMPKTLKQYIHRAGRTARAGNKGRCCTFVGQGHRKLLKDIIKNTTREKVCCRVIPWGAVETCKAAIADMEHDIRDIITDEHHEKELRVAEMQMNKASNMLQHRDDIYTRPPRTWFQTTNEKNESRKAGWDEMDTAADAAADTHKKKKPADVEDSEDDDEGKGGKRKKRKAEAGDKADKKRDKVKRGPLDGLSRKQKRRKMQDAGQDTQALVKSFKLHAKHAKAQQRSDPSPRAPSKAKGKSGRSSAASESSRSPRATASLFSRDAKAPSKVRAPSKGKSPAKSKKRYKRR